MEVIGTGACGGVAMGRIYVYEKRESVEGEISTADIAEEVNRFQSARDIAKNQLRDLYNQVVSEIGEEGASIFKAQQLMFDDPEFMGAVQGMIVDEGVTSEYAVKFIGNRFYTMFSKIDDAYMRARAADVLDVITRITNILESRPYIGIKLTEPSIILAEELSPSETVQLDKNMVLAFVTRYGSTNSHTSILAKNMNLPAIVCAEYPVDCNGKTAIVDGDSGLLIIDPNEVDILEYEARHKTDEEEQEQLEEFINLEDVSLSGKKIKLYANIGGIEDVDKVVEYNAQGIGLYRTEFLYLQTDSLPNEEELFFSFLQVAEYMEDKPVIIRTMDIGADKQAAYFNLEPEVNPALGYRGIRISLDMMDVFKTELKAIYRASAYGNLSIMLPLITSVEEIKKAKVLIDEIKQELDEEGAEYSNVPLGVMIETPAAVMMAQEIGQEVDFLSVGTNDLTQYTLVADRQNPRLESIYDAKHPAMLKMLQMVVDGGHESGCWVGICGDLGADPEMTEALLEMGFDELSVPPGSVLKIRKQIRQCE